MKAVRLLFSFSGTIGRLPYVGVAVAGASIKQVIDLTIAGAFHREWDPTRYIMPLGVSINSLQSGDVRFLGVMLACALPFAWIGLAITTRRFRTIGWPLWLVVLFFVPIANIASFAVAAAWPECQRGTGVAAESRLARIVPGDPLGAAVFGLVVAGALGAVLVPIATVVLGSYGWGLFAAIPFAQGAIAASAYGLHGRRNLGSSVLVALLSVGVTAAALLALALEGAACIAMAAPIAAVFAVIGAIFAHSIGGGRLRPNVALAVVCAVLAPTIMGAEVVTPRVAPLYEVTTSIDVAAPPDIVWANVVRFPDLPPPTELPFRIGIAYPIRAKIVGRGAGATRYCEFSTGSFVEPITAWQPGRRLAFSVTKNPEPMHEWSPYGHIETPHLHDYMQSHRGQFLLEPLPNGGTRLTGTTWYQHHLWPAAYWRLWSDAIVHDIHYRVLRHIATLSERQALHRQRS